MNALRAIVRTIGGIFSGLFDFLGTLLRGMFGELRWQPPGWLSPLLAGTSTLGAKAIAQLRARPRLAAGGLVAVIAFAGLTVAGVHWQRERAAAAKATATVPQDVVVTADALAATCYDCTPVSVNPLRLRFAASVAPLEQVGKPLPEDTKAVRLAPAQPGRWRWEDDRTLVFTPAKDWPIGTHFTVAIDADTLLLKGVTSAVDQLAFDTPPFKVWVQESAFIQDPNQPALKTARFVVRASHPLDEESLKKRLTLKAVAYRGERGTEESERPAPAWQLVFDAAHLTATLTTEPIVLAESTSRLDLVIDSGVVSSLGGVALAEAQKSKVEVPGRTGLKVAELSASIARDADDTPVQTLTLQLSQSATEPEVRGKVQAWLLPAKHPVKATQKAFESEDGNAGQPFAWTEATALAALQQAEALPLTLNALEAEHSELHSFRHAGEPGRYLLVRVNRGLKAFGGYELGQNYDTVLQVPPFAPELRLTHRGALLALSGSKKLTLFSRDLPGIRVQIGRLLPQQLQHVVTQTGGRLDTFSWNNWSFDETNVTESFTQDITLPQLPHGTAHYEPLDLSRYLAQGEGARRGVFFLKLTGYDPVAKKVIESNSNNSEGEGEGGYDYGARTSDTRLVVVTDLGLVSKRNKDGTAEVFVQSIATGEPVAGAAIEVIAKNGQSVVSRSTDATGHAALPALNGYERERTPVLILARRNGDESFLPLDGRSGNLDYSRFDVGGVSQAVEPGALSAYFFTDRGIYRPGEQAHIGVVVKASEFGRALPALPIAYEVTDPRGATVFKTSQPLPPGGLDELLFNSSTSSPSGTYTVTATAPGAKPGRPIRLGGLDFKVREFEPDRLKINLTLNASRSEGWLKPEAIRTAHVDLQNLFGTPAQDRRVTGELKLTPWLPSFTGFADYQFTDPLAAKEGVTVSLNDAKTGTDGQADLALDLKPYAAASYYLKLATQGFEPDGGRGVTTDVGQVISTLPYLIGWRSEQGLDWIAKGSKPSIDLVAIDPAVKRTAAEALTLRRYERQWVSVLVKSESSGYYHYESRQKDRLTAETKFAVPAAGTALTLDTSQPGSFLYTVVDANGQTFAKIPYEVSGYGNVSRSLDKNAELKITLSKKDYAPGDEVEINLVAPYAGNGLITIEREKVLGWQWFRSASTASVQKIRIPAGLEGSAYVHVLYTRDPASEDVFSAPLSYGVAPFSVAIDARRAPLTLTAPTKIKPGDTLKLTLTAAKPGRAVVYAVDEGILQVARYQAPDPLGFYFQKRSLDVRTLQILDLILPEFRGLPGAAAPGGDADNALAGKQNPFRRKTDPPIAWWSGVVEVGSEAKTLTWQVPDRFNGSLKLMAVQVTAEAIGVAQGKTLVRGDFTLLPNAPLVVTPGDEFEVSTGVSNNIETAPKDAPVVVTLAPSANLEVLGEAAQTLKISALREGVARYRVRARDALGNGELAFSASYGGKVAKISSTLSVRPPMPFSPNLTTLQVLPGNTVELPVSRAADLYPQFRQVEASVSSLPLVLAHGLTAYLGHYDHYCTEQLTSMAMPALVLSSRPEFGTVKRDSERGGSLSGLINELALRQLPEGDFAYWTRGGAGYEPVSIYALHFLLEARDRGLSVPPAMLEAGNRFLLKVARQEPRENTPDYYYRGEERRYGYSDRDVAYAIYLLTRQGELLSAEADAAVKRLDADPKQRGWRRDSTALWLAAAYSRMQRQSEANALVNGVIAASGDKATGWAWQHGGWFFANRLSVDAETLYLLAKHFPVQLAQYGPVLSADLTEEINRGHYQSYASGTTLLALDAYSTVAKAEQGKTTAAEVDAKGGVKPLVLPSGAHPRVALAMDTVKLRVTNAGTLPSYALVSENGFPRKTPTAAQAHGLEVIREFRDTQGNVVSKATLGQALTVELKFRALDRDAVTGVALVDLLPGGFEIVVPQTAAADQTLAQASLGDAPPVDESSEGEAGTSEMEGDNGSESVAKGACNCDWVTIKDGQLDFAEPREDRAVLYGNASRQLQTLRYQIKAITAGTFTLPPAYIEALYDRGLYGFSAGGKLEVVKP